MESINEAIKHAREVAEEKRNYFAPSGEFMGDNPDCVKCAEEHEQLAEWLEELKEARKGFEENRKAGYKHGYADGYKQAVDEFAKRLKTDYVNFELYYIFQDNEFADDTTSLKYYQKMIDEIAEELKATRGSE